MTPQEAAGLLTICAGFDNRKPDADTAKAWSLALDGLRFVDCRDAVVAHYQRSRDWIMPFDIISGVKRVRSDRVKQHFSYFTPPDGLTPAQYSQWHHDTTQAIGDGDLRAEDSPTFGLPARNNTAELTSRVRVNALPVERVASHAEIARQAARASRIERQATTPPEPEPLVRPEDRLREGDLSEESA